MRPNPYPAQCDGGSFSGDVLKPVQANSTYVVYFRGLHILRAIIATLQSDHGLAQAESVLVTGCSAGGLATFFQADNIAAMVHERNPATLVVAAPGAGFFLDTLSFAGQNLVEGMYKWVVDNHNLTASLKPQCVSDVAPRDPSVCFIAPIMLKYIQTPLFVSNSLTDAAQTSFVMGLPCSPASGNCNSTEIAYVDKFNALMIEQLAVVLKGAPKYGAFLVNCEVHMVQDVDGAFSSITVNGATHAQTLGHWFKGEAGGVQVDALWSAGPGPHGGNAQCGAYAPVPSSPGGP